MFCPTTVFSAGVAIFIFHVSLYCLHHRQRAVSILVLLKTIFLHDGYTGLFISPSGTSELDCATTKTDTTERSI